MFYSIFYMPKANYTLRDNKRMKVVGYLVKLGKQFLTIQPETTVVSKNGHKQFWFHHINQPVVAIQGKNGQWTAKIN